MTTTLAAIALMAPLAAAFAVARCLAAKRGRQTTRHERCPVGGPRPVLRLTTPTGHQQTWHGHQAGSIFSDPDDLHLLLAPNTVSRGWVNQEQRTARVTAWNTRRRSTP